MKNATSYFFAMIAITACLVAIRYYNVSALQIAENNKLKSEAHQDKEQTRFLMKQQIQVSEAISSLKIKKLEQQLSNCH